LPVDKLSITDTWYPRFKSASDKCDPIKPAPPVINALIGLSLVHSS